MSDWTFIYETEDTLRCPVVSPCNCYAKHWRGFIGQTQIYSTVGPYGVVDNCDSDPVKVINQECTGHYVRVFAEGWRYGIAMKVLELTAILMFFYCCFTCFCSKPQEEMEEE